jgi:beta-mannosidase
LASFVSCSANHTEWLTEGWQCLVATQRGITTPSELADASWITAPVPGTAATALRAAGAWNGTSPLELDNHDVWYRVRFAGGGAEVLSFEGLATIADVWLNGEHLLRSETMFLPCEATVWTQRANTLFICFRSLTAWLEGQQGRARWRTRLAVPRTLRFARTTLLGRMPGWCPTVHPVGPWRPVRRLHRTAPFAIVHVDVRASVYGHEGRLVLRVELDGEVPVGSPAGVEIGGRYAPLAKVTDRTLAGEVVVPNVTPWWPHTHGPPHLYRATLRIGEVVCDLGRIGFRHIEVDRGADGIGFALRVNGESIFCRGACWTSPDIVALPGDAASYRPWLEAARDAGMNMIRISGTMLYEADDFYALCDELGLLVWQDAMLASFDYPTTDAFHSVLAAELEHFLARTQSHACLAVLCGGSEMLQQAAMFGLDKDRIDDTLCRCVIPRIVEQLRPDLAYVPNSPSGGALPFQTNAGVAHYYGVGAYLRPLDDARRAEVRFASECLALANVPCPRTVDTLQVASGADARWQRAIPRDPGAAWDFEDVRDHYLQTLYQVDARHLREADFARYLDLSRAVSCTLAEHVFGEWRRVGSGCHGGLIWQLQDLMPGAGWGIVDSLGRRKPVWHALQRALRPQQLIITDEGLNGLALHVLNEAPQPLHGVLRIICLQDGTITLREAERSVCVPPRGALRIDSTELLPSFFDISYAYRFGSCAHDVTIATLSDVEHGSAISEACHFPVARVLPSRDLDLEVAVEQVNGRWWLCLRAARFVQFMHVEDAAFAACEDWLHLRPGREYRIALQADHDGATVPDGEVRALNLVRPVRYSGRA